MNDTVKRTKYIDEIHSYFTEDNCLSQDEAVGMAFDLAYQDRRKGMTPHKFLEKRMNIVYDNKNLSWGEASLRFAHYLISFKFGGKAN